jgi:hypothetical protein
LNHDISSCTSSVLLENPNEVVMVELLNNINSRNIII